MRFTRPRGSNQITKFIKATMQIIRKSYEYKQWVKYLKGNGFNYDPITHETDEEATIEIHHHPLRLYDYVLIAITYLENNGILETTFDIAKLVIKWHYDELVGFVPLTKTNHEKFHNGSLEIPIDIINGNWQDFIRQFNEYMPDETLYYLENIMPHDILKSLIEG